MTDEPIGGKATTDARQAVDEMVAAWQLHDAARGVPGASINAPRTVATLAKRFTREQTITALAYATRTIARLTDEREAGT